MVIKYNIHIKYLNFLDFYYFSIVDEDNLPPALETSVGPPENPISSAVIEEEGPGEDEVYEVYLPVVHGLPDVPGEGVAPSKCRNDRKDDIIEPIHPGD